MRVTPTLFAVLALALTSGCASTKVSHEITGAKQPKVEGQVLVTQSPLPDSVQHEVVGTVKARARSGYSSAKSLFPLLAEEARKIGANAVVGVEGGRHVAPFSWAAPHASGTAVRVDDPKALEQVEGDFY